MVYILLLYFQETRLFCEPGTLEPNLTMASGKQNRWGGGGGGGGSCAAWYFSNVRLYCVFSTVSLPYLWVVWRQGERQTNLWVSAITFEPTNYF